MSLMVTTTACKAKKEIASSNQTEGQNQRGQKGKRGAPSIEEVFKMDTNNDGKLSKLEIKGRLLKHFSEIDSNNDGFITKTEFQNAPKPQKGQGRPPKN